MRVFDICLKDLKQVLGDRRSLLFLVAMPLVFTLFMGFAYRSGSEGGAEAALIDLGWVSEDPDGSLSLALHALLADWPGIALTPLAEDARLVRSAEENGWPDAAREAVRSAKIAGVLLVPAGYSQRNGLDGGGVLTLITNSGTAEGQALAQAVRPAVARVESAAQIAGLAAETGGPEVYAGALRDALQAWEGTNTGALISTRTEAEAVAFWYGNNPYNMASPGILVQFAIMALVSTANILLAERKARTLERMITTSLARWQILLGHALGMLAIALLQVVLLVVFGQLVLGVDYLRTPIATLLVSLALGMWVAGLGLAIGIVAKDDSQVVLFALLAMFILSALGGTWFPLDLVGGPFAAIGRAAPSGLAMTGYQNMLMRGLGLESMWAPVLGMLGWAAGLGAVAWVLFRRQV